MNNLEHEKECLHSNNSFRDFLEIKENEIDEITPEKIANVINGDCDICLCYGCRLFTRNYSESKYAFDKKQCHGFIIAYFSRDFNPDTDNCQCPSCRTRRGEDTDKHYWKLSYKNKECVIYEKSLPEAKSLAINKKIYNKEDYPYIIGKIIDNEEFIN